MSTGDGAALVRRAVEEIWNRGDLDLGDALFAPSYVSHEGAVADLVRGPEAIKISVALYRTAFPALHVTIEDLVAAGDRVALRWTTRVEAPPAEAGGDDARGTVTGLTLCRLYGGQIAETWTCMNALGAVVPTGSTDEPSADAVADSSKPSFLKPPPSKTAGRRRYAAARFSRLCHSLSALRKAGGK
jgi:hypothetical protein